MEKDINEKKYSVMFDVLKELEIRNVRDIFWLMRHNPDLTPNVFFPAYGVTAGEFTLSYIMNMPARCRQNKKTVQREDVANAS